MKVRVDECFVFEEVSLCKGDFVMLVVVVRFVFDGDVCCFVGIVLVGVVGMLVYVEVVEVVVLG